MKKKIVRVISVAMIIIVAMTAIFLFGTAMIIISNPSTNYFTIKNLIRQWEVYLEEENKHSR